MADSQSKRDQQKKKLQKQKEKALKKEEKNSITTRENLWKK